MKSNNEIKHDRAGLWSLGGTRGVVSEVVNSDARRRAKVRSDSSLSTEGGGAARIGATAGRGGLALRVGHLGA
jgi:hypothetical protein